MTLKGSGVRPPWLHQLTLRRRDRAGAHLTALGMGCAAFSVEVGSSVAGIGGKVLAPGRRVLQPVERARRIFDMGVYGNTPCQFGDVCGDVIDDPMHGRIWPNTDTAFAKSPPARTMRAPQSQRAFQRVPVASFTARL